MDKALVKLRMLFVLNGEGQDLIRIKFNQDMNTIIIKSFTSILFILICSCNNGQTKEVVTKAAIPERDTSISESNAFSELFLDSITVEQFIEEYKVNEERSKQLRSFYNSRNYQFAWFTKDGLAQQGSSFWNLHNNYVNYSKDSSFYNKQLHKQMEILMNEQEDDLLTASAVTMLELQLTEHFFDYAQYAFTGKVDPDELKWHIPRKKINPIALLDSLIKNNGAQAQTWEPLNNQYKLLRNKLIQLYEIKKRGGWPLIEGENKIYEKGDTSIAIQRIKERLRISGDYTEPDNSSVFTNSLRIAVVKAQKRFGLKKDGVIGPNTIKALNVPVEERIKQLLVNMERMRWMPPEKEGKRLVANIPEFKLHVYEGEKEVLDMKIVVGKAANRTVVFNDQLKYVVFSPYWNIPRSIVRNEILPAMRNNPGYLDRRNMEQTGNSGGLPIIRQKPGAGNALGRVKFIFPNSYNIYFHDTPAKSLFSETKRAFSHGCIRLEKPEKLANYLLQDNAKWTSEDIRKAMYSGTEKWVALEEPVSVVISYYTAWVDNEGLLNYRDDIYGHDKELGNRLFQ